jgi:cytochrome c5
MKDEGFEHAHTTPIKTPRQLVTVIVLAFVVPVIVIIMLAQLVTGGKRLDERTLEPEAVAGRIQPVARVEFGAAAPGGAAGAPKSGEEVYKAVCAACHASGVAGAHKFGDKAAWAPHLKEGLADLSKNAINGIRGMPARGGNPNLSDVEVTRAVVYMANAAGANFKEPEAPKAEAKPAQAAAPAPAQVAAAPAAAPAAAAPAAPAPAAAAGGELLQKSGCVACHATDKKLVGPSYKDIAAKYGSDKDALDKLAKKVKAGGAGVWGQIAMPPHGHVADADIQAMVKYVLAQK